MAITSPTNVLFGEGSDLHARGRKFRSKDDEQQEELPRSSPPANGVARFFFGFMYEEEYADEYCNEDDVLYRSTIEPSTHIWNPLNAALFLSLLLNTAATAIPVTLTAAMAADLMQDTAEAVNDGSSTATATTTASAFAAHTTAAAVLGTALGKFLMGPCVDVLGARRCSVACSLGLSLTLLMLAMTAGSLESVARCCFWAEFFASAQWPCNIVWLATHYRGSHEGMYEGGIYVTSLAARLGSLLGIPCGSLLLRQAHQWRLVAVVGAWMALVASSVTYLHVDDSPNEKNAPQNPIDPNQLRKWFPQVFGAQPPDQRGDHYRRRQSPSLASVVGIVYYVFRTHVFPSLVHVMSSATFWIVALAHSGASMVRSSERILGSYLVDTSQGTLSSSRASGLAAFVSVGTVAGLVIAGNLFASRPERPRKWLVSRLYVLSIASCYVLALLAIPWLQRTINAPSLITTFQVMAATTAGFGIAVQLYHIPSLVGATFGVDKGLYSAYTDGVAYGLSSWVWRCVVGASVMSSSSNGNEQSGGGAGWAYGWAAVALLLILSALLMVEFMEHYFCRNRTSHGGTYETILLA